MKPNSLHPAPVAGSRDSAGWPVAGLFLDALTQRDFATMSTCLDPEVRLRGLIPRGPIEAHQPDGVIGYFTRWFGGTDDFEIIDASIGQVRRKVYLRWKVRMQSPSGAARVAEQHVFADIGDRIAQLDLLCSGWQPVDGVQS